MASRDDLARQLSRLGLRPSTHRVRVLSYLQEHRCHPTIDGIYTALRSESASLSRSTVYNVLRAFADAGLVLELDFDGIQTHYDIGTHPHGHFQCRSCGMIKDFDVDFAPLAAPELKGFDVHERGVLFKGLCPDCVKMQKTDGGDASN